MKTDYTPAHEAHIDDIFARPPRALARQQAAQQVRITCRVCALAQLVTLTNDALVCDDCRADPDASRARVQTWLASVVDQEQQAYEEWEWTRNTYRPYWAKIVEARGGGRPDADARARAAHPTYALLLDAEARYQAELTPLQSEKMRLELALQELSNLSQ
jgi:hypothetical protein